MALSASIRDVTSESVFKEPELTGKRSLTAMISTAMLMLAIGSADADETNHCISTRAASFRLEREPVAIAGLDLPVSLPREGFVQVGEMIRPSPVGDFTNSAGPFDPASQRLYLWAYSQNGWINVRTGESGVIRPPLYFPANDVEDSTFIERSEVLGVQFYSGYTAPHWLTGAQFYRVYQIDGAEMTRVAALEARMLRYVGDDPEAGLAVFARADVLWPRDLSSLAWYDGERITSTFPSGPPVRTRRCDLPE